MSAVEHGCSGNQEVSLVQKGQRYKEQNEEEYKQKSRVSKLLSGRECSGVGGRESRDLELHLTRFCGYNTYCMYI